MKYTNYAFLKMTCDECNRHVFVFRDDRPTRMVCSCQVGMVPQWTKVESIEVIVKDIELTHDAMAEATPEERSAHYTAVRIKMAQALK